MKLTHPPMVSIVEIRPPQVHASGNDCRSKVIWGASGVRARLTLRRSVAMCALLIVLPFAQPLQAQSRVETGWVAVNTNVPTMPIAASMSRAAPKPAQVTAPVWTPSSGCGRDCGDIVKSGRRSLALPALYAGLGLMQGLDLYSTSQALKYGAHEANPFMKGVVGNRAASIAVKSVSSAAIIYFAERLRKKSPAAAVTMMVIANGVTAAIVAHNFKNARMLAAGR